MKHALRTTPGEVAAALAGLRPELTRYLTWLIVRPDAVEDILAATAEHALGQATNAPRRDAELRIWLYRLATGYSEREWTLRPTWRENDLPDALARARRLPEVVRETETRRGTREMTLVARDHVAFCLALTVADLPHRHAAALHLDAVLGFKPGEIAEILDARVAQIERWVEEARGAVEERLGQRCGLARGRGPCRQCLELDRGFGAGRGDPLEAGDSLDARIAVLRKVRDAGLGSWHRLLVRGLDQATQAEPGRDRRGR